MQREPRLEKKKHLEAEQRLRTYFTRISMDPAYTYEGKEDDVALIRRKHRELSHEQLRRVIEGGGGNSYGRM